MLLKLWLCMIVTLGLAGPVLAELTSEQIRHAKRATALVEIPPGRAVVVRGVRAVSPEKGFGSAFCIDPAGLFVTSAHVADAAVNKELKLILNASEKDQQVVVARILRSDKNLDLALLQVSGAKGLAALERDTVDHLLETQQVLALGFPFGVKLSLERDEYPSISVNTGRITSLRKRQGELELIQLDAALNPGNSGGPVLNAVNGKVVGIVQSGVIGSGVNFAVPASHLNKLVVKPEIVLTPPAVTSGNQHREVEFDIQIITLARPTPEYAVTATLITGDTRREFPCRAGSNHKYSFRAAPVPGSSAPARIRIAANFPKGTLSGNCEDRALPIGKRRIPLSDIRRIDAGEKSVALLNSGERIEIGPEVLKPIEVDLGGVFMALDLAKARSATIERLEQPICSIEYTVKVSLKDEVLAKLDGTIPIADAPATQPVAATTLPVGPTTREARLELDNVVRPLMETVDDVIAGANGRLLFLRMRKARKLAVFDVVETQVTKLIPLPSDDVRLAATSDKLLIMVSDMAIVQRWDLQTLEREVAARLPDIGQLDDVVSGYASAGPAMLLIRNGGPRFLDVATLKLSDPKYAQAGGAWQSTGRGRLRASADGSAFAGWSTSGAPAGIRLLTLTGDLARCQYQHETAGTLLPSYDGQLLFTSNGIYSSKLKPLSDSFRGIQCVPAYHPSYFLAIHSKELAADAGRAVDLTLHSAGDRRQLAKIFDLQELRPTDSSRSSPDEMPLDKRIHLIPQHKVLITLNTAADKLVLRRFDLAQVLAREGTDYLFVSSAPSCVASRGKTWTYRPEVQSRRGGVRISLDSGPAGMTISDSGELQWNVPTGVTDPSVSVILSIRDASAQEIFHTFTLVVK